MNIETIKEIRGKSFIIDYEYVSESLKRNRKLAEPSFIAEIKSKIYMLFQEFSRKGISYFPTMNDIGVNNEGEPKVFLPLTF